jgi:hypothetical protein
VPGECTNPKDRPYHPNNLCYQGSVGVYSIFATVNFDPKKWKSPLWKYGITTQGAARPRSQTGQCDTYFGGDEGKCAWDWIAYTTSREAARKVESGKIGEYLGMYHELPPGNRGGS